MSTTNGETDQVAQSEPDKELHKALAHPLRKRIIKHIEKHGPISPKKFTIWTEGTKQPVSLNLAAYHIKQLSERYGALEIRELIPRRGATEHVYGINPESPIPDMLRTAELLAELKGDEPSGDSTGVSILPVEVDKDGEAELTELLTGVAARVREIEENSGARAEASGGSKTRMRLALASYRPEPDPEAAEIVADDAAVAARVPVVV